MPLEVFALEPDRLRPKSRHDGGDIRVRPHAGSEKISNDLGPDSLADQCKLAYCQVHARGSVPSIRGAYLFATEVRSSATLCRSSPAIGVSLVPRRGRQIQADTANRRGNSGMGWFVRCMRTCRPPAAG